MKKKQKKGNKSRGAVVKGSGRRGRGRGTRKLESKSTYSDLLIARSFHSSFSTCGVSASMFVGAGMDSALLRVSLMKLTQVAPSPQECSNAPPATPLRKTIKEKLKNGDGEVERKGRAHGEQRRDIGEREERRGESARESEMRKRDEKKESTLA
jgi:hypothetical protein